MICFNLYSGAVVDNNKNIKEVVKEKYGAIALSVLPDEGSCGCCTGQYIDYTVMSDDYSRVEGYVSSADLGLGCGIPTEFADIKDGESVLDLGSGAGNDAFVARRYVGPGGKVTGLDMTPEMVAKAKENNSKLQYDNVEFILGEIEQMPLDDESFNLIISNCVLNLVPDKSRAFSEMFRVMKHGGRFCISDIVLNGALPEKIREGVLMYAGCVAGAVQKHEYLDTISEAGFVNTQIKKQKAIHLPDEILLQYVSPEELTEIRRNPNLVESVTVYGEKK